MSLIKSLKQAIFHRNCLLCQLKLYSDIWFCDDCRQSLPSIEQACPICAIPVPYNGICGRCLSDPPYFDSAHVPFEFKSPISKFIYQFKYKHQFYAYRPLINELTKLINISEKILPEIIVPIPLHPRRLRKRGFNQSILIAKTLAKELCIPLNNQLLIRNKFSRPQVELSAKEREKAVKNSFKANSNVSAKHIAIVDDVITTSHTVNHAAKTLKEAGAEKVSIWALARNTG